MKKENTSFIDNIFVEFNNCDKESEFFDFQLFINKFSEFIYKEYIDKTIFLSYTALKNEEMIDLNNKYLNHDYNTDIITFKLEDSENQLIIDLYINFETIKNNSDIYQTLYGDEIVRVLYHGYLHCIGFNDDDEQNINIMRKKEDEFLNYFKNNVSRETIIKNYT